MNIEEDKELFPYLRYVAVMDNAVRDEHAILNDTIKEVNDPFWRTYYPPNGWNCRCSVEQLTAEEAQALGGATSSVSPVRIDPDFKGNPALDKSLYGRWLKNKSIPKFTAEELNLKPFNEAYEKSKLPETFDTKKMSKPELIELWRTYTDNRIINNIYGAPVLLKKDVTKFGETKESDLQGRFKYLRCLDEVIESPDEIWSVGEADKHIYGRHYYLKRYSKNIQVLVDINLNGELEAFNLLIRKRDIENKRQGLPLYLKK